MKLSSIPLFSMHGPPPLWKFFENSSILGKQASLSCWTRFLLCWEPLRHVISTTEHSDFQEWNCDQEKSWLRRRKMLNFNSQIVFVFFCVTCLCFLCICVFVCLYLCSEHFRKIWIFSENLNIFGKSDKFPKIWKMVGYKARHPRLDPQCRTTVELSPIVV